MTVIFGMLVLSLTGCPALMLGSLGYEGYEYEKTGSLPGMPPQTAPSHEKTNPQPTPSATDTE